MGKKGVIGIDIGGTKTLCVLFDHRLRPLSQVKFKTSPADGRATFTRRLKDSVRQLTRLAEKDKLDLAGIGIACAGEVDPKRCVVKHSANILCLEDYPIGTILKRSVNLPAVIGNDVQLALYCEHKMGAAKGCAQVLGVFFGTGVGGAAIINNRLYVGAGGHGGQVGATLTQPIGGAETLESHGILDRLASKSAIAGAAIGMGIKQWAPHLYKEVGTDISKVTWGALARARKAGDRQIDDLIRSRLRVVGIALSTVVNFMNPEMLVLGGGLSEEMPQLVVNALEPGLREYITPEVSRDLRIKTAKFGNKAGTIGAARLALKQLEG